MTPFTRKARFSFTKFDRLFLSSLVIILPLQQPQLIWHGVDHMGGDLQKLSALQSLGQHKQRDVIKRLLLLRFKV
jgi:hypothetical protein